MAKDDETLAPGGQFSEDAAYYWSVLQQQVPDWSPETLELLSKLTVLERGFVEWMCTGRSATESYRIASGRLHYYESNAGDIACRMKHKADVKAALESALRDRGFAARYDREFFLQQLGTLVLRYNVSPSPHDWEKIPPIIDMMARLKGEYVTKKEMIVDNRSGGRDVHTIVAQIIAEATAPRVRVAAVVDGAGNGGDAGAMGGPVVVLNGGSASVATKPTPDGGPAAPR